MLLPLVALLQVAPPPAQTTARDQRPVRVWLGTGGLLTRGTPVRVYVRAAQDGNLIVLHRRTDGRIEVLFPSNPTDDAFIRAGTYEIQATAGRVAFVVAEPDGSGLVLAALAPARYRFDEFVREAAWNPDALAPSWNGSDGVGAVSDIVQRMLGDDYFNYDIATYSVAPPVYAMQQDSGPPPSLDQLPTYPTCTDCTFIGFQENVFEPLALCDAFFSPCVDSHFRHFARHDLAPTAATTNTIALALPGPSGRALIPQNGRAARSSGSGGFPAAPGGFVRKGSTLVTPGIGPRGRVPAAIPLVAGRRTVTGAAPRDLTRRRVTSAPASVAQPPFVRLTLSPTTPPDETDRAPRTGTVVLTGLAVTRAEPPPPQPPAARLDARERVASRAQPSEALPRTRAVAMAGGNVAVTAPAGSGGGEVAGTAGAAGAAPGHATALPSAVFHGAQARIPVPRTGARRR